MSFLASWFAQHQIATIDIGNSEPPRENKSLKLRYSRACSDFPQNCCEFSRICMMLYSKTSLLVILSVRMEYVGEYVVPIAAIILVAAVWYWEGVGVVVLLLKRLLRRLL